MTRTLEQAAVFAVHRIMDRYSEAMRRARARVNGFLGLGAL
jgi:hypothetical protein